MTAYATRDQFAAYVPGWVTDSPDALDALLERASRDIDLILGPIAIVTDATSDYLGFKLDPTQLLGWEAKALANATCAQAEHLWRTEVHRQGVVEASSTNGGARVKSEAGPEISITYDLSTSSTAATDYRDADRDYGPKVKRELGPIAHLRVLGGRAAA
jgi:hypothetical protein